MHLTARLEEQTPCPIARHNNMLCVRIRTGSAELRAPIKVYHADGRTPRGGTKDQTAACATLPVFKTREPRN